MSFSFRITAIYIFIFQNKGIQCGDVYLKLLSKEYVNTLYHRELNVRGNT